MICSIMLWPNNETACCSWSLPEADSWRSLHLVAIHCIVYKRIYTFRQKRDASKFEAFLNLIWPRDSCRSKVSNSPLMQPRITIKYIYGRQIRFRNAVFGTRRKVTSCFSWRGINAQKTCIRALIASCFFSDVRKLWETLTPRDGSNQLT